MFIYDIPDTKKGDTFIGVQFTLQVNAVLVDLTGASIRMHLKVDKNEGTPATLMLQTGDGITITDAVNGEFQVDPQIIDCPANCYYYDIEIEFPDDTVKTYIEGEWTITQDITQ